MYPGTQSESTRRLRNRFAKTDSLSTAFKIAWLGHFNHHAFQHYTTFSALLSMVKNRQFWLTRGTSATLDDAHEREKFGSSDVWRRTYIASFSYGDAESAAMWGLYCKGAPNAVRITIPQKAMQLWVDDIMDHRKAIVNPQPTAARSRSEATIYDVRFRDLVYAAVNGRGLDEEDRNNVLFWNDAYSKPILNPKSFHDRSETGFLKDFEWAFERESRLVVRLSRNRTYGSRIAVPMPESVFEQVSITLGPWASDHDVESYTNEYKLALAEIVPNSSSRLLILRSVLCGALRKWGKESSKNHRRRRRNHLPTRTNCNGECNG